MSDDDILAGLRAQQLADVGPFASKLGASAPPASSGFSLPDRGLFGRKLLTNPAAIAAATTVYPPLGLAMGQIAPPANPRDPATMAGRMSTGGLADTDPSAMSAPGGMKLTPIEPGPSADTDIAAAPTLDPRYGLRKPGMLGGPGGMSQGNGLKAAYDADRQRMVDDYDQDKHLAYVQGANTADRMQGMAGLAEREAAIKQRHAELQQQADAEAAQKHEAFLARNQQLADEIGEKKIDVKAAFGHAGEKAMMLLGGMLMSKAGQGQQAMAMFNKHVDTAIAAQQAEIDNKKARVQARQSIFGKMLQETGDRRLAALQTRNLMLEAAKQKIGADAERLGIPSAKVAAEQQVNAFQHQQDALKTQIDGDAWSMYQRQAAAQAAARANAEKQAMELAFRVSAERRANRELDIKENEANRKTTDDVEKQVQSLGKEMSDKDLAEGRSAVENAKRRLATRPENEGLPGVGGGADLRDKLAPKPSGAAALNPGAWLNYGVAGLNDQERVSRGDWDKVKLSYQKQITGSGASEKEREMISKAFEGAKSPAEQRAAIANADSFFQQLEQRKMAGYSPQAQEIFKQRLTAQSGKK